MWTIGKHVLLTVNESKHVHGLYLPDLFASDTSINMAEALIILKTEDKATFKFIEEVRKCLVWRTLLL